MELELRSVLDPGQTSGGVDGFKTRISIYVPTHSGLTGNGREIKIDPPEGIEEFTIFINCPFRKTELLAYKFTPLRVTKTSGLLILLATADTGRLEMVAG